MNLIRRFVSRILQLFHDFGRLVIKRLYIPAIEGCPNEGIQGGGNQDVVSEPEVDEETAARETAPKKLSVVGYFVLNVSRNVDLQIIIQKERLETLSSLRMHPDDIVIAASPSGRGGKASVIQATFKRTQEEQVAIKKLLCSRSTNNDKFSKEFVHEVETLAGLTHDNIVRLIGFIEELEEGKAWIVLAWEPNGNVREFLGSGESWEIPERISLIKDTFAGIEYLHTRQPPVCHGDLKSLNILVSASYRAIITDFGSARSLRKKANRPVDNAREHARAPGESPSTEDRAVQPEIDISASGDQLTLAGPAWTLRWAAPEVVMEDQPDLPSDMWAAGWVCWEIMTEKIPFSEARSEGTVTLRVVQGRVPSAREHAQLSQIIRLCTVMKGCWALDPRDRPTVSECFKEVKWMPSSVPLGVTRSGPKAQSIPLMLEMGRMHYLQDSNEEAISVLSQALAVAGSSGDHKACAEALKLLGHVHRGQSKYPEAEEYYIRAQTISARIADDLGEANTLLGLGKVHRLRCKYTQAEEAFARAQELYIRIDDKHGQATVLEGLGDVCLSLSKFTDATDERWRSMPKTAITSARYTEAKEHYGKSLEAYDSVGDELGRANMLLGLGNVSRLQHEDSQAEEHYVQAQDIYNRINCDLGRADTLRDLGHLRRQQGRHREAAKSFAEARDIFARIGNPKEVKAAEQSLNLLAVLEEGEQSATPPLASNDSNPPAASI